MDRKQIIILTAIVLLCHPRLMAQNWYETYEKGRDAFSQQKWQEAVRYLTEVIDEKPASKAKMKTYGMQFIDYFPYVYRGAAYAKLGDRARALVDLEKAEAEGVVQNGREDTEAQRVLRENLELLRKTPVAPQTDARFTEGVRLYNLKDYKGAIDQFKAVAANSPQYKEATRYLGLAQTEQRKLEAAATLKDKNDRIQAAFTAGVNFFNQNEYDKAEERFTAVLQLDAERTDARQYLLRIKAQKHSLAAAAKTPTKEPSRESVKTPEKARENREVVIQPKVESITASPPDTTNLVMFRDGVALLNGGKIGLAKAKFTGLKQREPSYPGLEAQLQAIGGIEEQARRGITAFLEGEYQQAIDQLREPAQKGNDNPHVYAFLACSYAAQYLLAGAEDRTMRQNAVDAFARTKQVDGSYALDSKLVSPRIITLLTGQ